jgi:hypothetical protein
VGWLTFPGRRGKSSGVRADRRAVDRLQQRRRVNPHGRPYHDRWAALLEGPLPRLLRTLNEVSELADALRQESPFTVLVPVDERRRIFDSIGKS